MNPDPLSSIEYEMVVLVRLITATRPSNPNMVALDRSAYLILNQLDRHQPIALSLLAERLKLDISTISRQVAAMEGKSLVERLTDPKDARACLVQITPDGLSQLAAMRAARRDTYAHVLKNWNPEELNALAATLIRLNRDIMSYKESGS